MRLAILNQCAISAGERAACLNLSFHLCINLLSRRSVTDDIPYSVLRLNFISLVLILLKALSEWDRLNSDNPQRSTHLSIRSFITLLPVSSSYLYTGKFCTGSYCFICFQEQHTNVETIFVPVFVVTVVFCPLPPNSHIYPS